MDVIFKGIFDDALTQNISAGKFFLCIAVSMLLGLVIVAVSLWKSQHSKSFFITLAILPAVVCVVIMMVNGSIGAGIAVAGAFSLVRFRSAPGSAKEIVTIFIAMGTGLIVGKGYLGYAVLFTVIMCLFIFVFSTVSSSFKFGALNKTIKITIPEDLDYTSVFDEIFKEYTKKQELIKVKTINLGSMFRLTYNVTLRDAKKEKEMIDRIRERNGNLEIVVSKQESITTEL